MARSKRGRPEPRRRSPYRKPRKRFLLVCEGTVTEPGYFEYVRFQLRDALIAIKVQGGGTPLQVVRKAIEERDKAAAAARRERDVNVAWDHIWGVVDVDEHADLPNARRLAAQEGISLAVSNPCFELWPLLHFIDQRAHLTGSAAQQRLRQHLPGYDKQLECDKLLGRFAQAHGRARDLVTQHERNGTDGNPSTDVFLLLDAVLAAARASARDPRVYDERL